MGFDCKFSGIPVIAQPELAIPDWPLTILGLVPLPLDATSAFHAHRLST